MRKFIILLLPLILFSMEIDNGPRVFNNTSICEPSIKAFLSPLGSVHITMYHPVEAQTNSNPDIVADNTRFNVNIASELEWIALSRDLHVRWGGPLRFNDIVYLEVSGNPGRFFKVKDIMNRRFTMRVDILETPGTPIYSFPEGILYKVEHPEFTREQLWNFYKIGVLSI